MVGKKVFLYLAVAAAVAAASGFVGVKRLRQAPLAPECVGEWRPAEGGDATHLAISTQRGEGSGLLVIPNVAGGYNVPLALKEIQPPGKDGAVLLRFEVPAG